MEGSATPPPSGVFAEPFTGPAVALAVGVVGASNDDSSVERMKVESEVIPGMTALSSAPSLDVTLQKRCGWSRRRQRRGLWVDGWVVTMANNGD